MLYFRIASITLLVISASHVAGHYFLLPHFTLTAEIPATETERRTLEMMNSYHKDVAGKQVSYMDIQNGLSLCYSMFFFWLGIINLMMAKGLVRNKRMLSHICLINTAMLMLGVVIAYQYFFWLPTISFVVAMSLFIVAALKLQRDF